MDKKDLFMEAMACILIHNTRQETFIKALDELSPDTYNDVFLYSEYEAMLIKILETLMNDEYELIQTFIYEMDWGRVHPSITINEKNFELTSVGDLYNCLIEVQK